MLFIYFICSDASQTASDTPLYYGSYLAGLPPSCLSPLVLHLSLCQSAFFLAWCQIRARMCFPFSFSLTNSCLCVHVGMYECVGANVGVGSAWPASLSSGTIAYVCSTRAQCELISCLSSTDLILCHKPLLFMNDNSTFICIVFTWYMIPPYIIYPHISFILQMFQGRLKK